MNLEQLRPEEMDVHVENGTFRLAFVGMSNAGKSYRSKVLEEENNFLWYHVDEKIYQELGLSSVEAISEWLGYPTGEGYDEREKEYLRLENTFTKEASIQTNGKNLVFDTTGSVVHLEDKTLGILGENCLVVHLDVGEDSLAAMMERFFAEPKPVAWSGYFTVEPGESSEDTVRRCYPKLLKERLRAYRKLAHLNIDAKDVYNTTGEETLRIIRSHL